MMVIRIIKRTPELVEVLLPANPANNESKQGATEKTLTIEQQSIDTFLDDWRLFWQASQQLTVNVNELRLKGLALHSILFGQLAPLEKIAKNRIVVFAIEDTLGSIPFEILPLRNSTLGESHIVLRRFRTRENDKATIVKGNNALLLYNSADNKTILASAKRENQKLQKLFARLGIPVHSLDLHKISLSSLMAALSEARFLHYSGHTSTKNKPFDKVAWLTLSSMKKWNLTNIEVAFFNSCNSASSGLHGIAGALVYAGVKTIVGFLYPLKNGDAESIATLYWQNYLKKNNSISALSKTKTMLGSQYLLSGLVQYGSEQQLSKSKIFSLTRAAVAIVFVLAASFLFRNGRWFTKSKASVSKIAEKKRDIRHIKRLTKKHLRGKNKEVKNKKKISSADSITGKVESHESLSKNTCVPKQYCLETEDESKSFYIREDLQNKVAYNKPQSADSLLTRQEKKSWPASIALMRTQLKDYSIAQPCSLAAQSFLISYDTFFASPFVQKSFALNQLSQLRSEYRKLQKLHCFDRVASRR